MRKIKQRILVFLFHTGRLRRFCGLLAAALWIFAALAGFSHMIDRQPGVVSANAQSDITVYPCGFPIGIYLRTGGIMVIGTARIPDEAGEMREPAAGCIFGGDYIVSINGEAVESKEDFQRRLNACGANPVTLTVNREGKEFPVSIQPVRGADGQYRLGLWVKDDIQGIGTMTYLTADGHFGALGHPISDTDTGKMVRAKSGGLYQAQIKMIVKGSNGNPGSFSGIICYDRSTCMGEIEKNGSCGIFGTLHPDQLLSMNLADPCHIGQKNQVSCGDAVLRCTIDKVTKDYRIVILNLNASSRSENGFLFQVTDPELLEKTGGIIQGMSGSPILQDGRLIGAVTHVFVQDSTRGYGIYIEDMIADSPEGD